MCDLLPTAAFPRGRSPRRAQSGTALVLSLITVMIIASLGAGLVQLHTAIDKRHEFSIDRRRALYIAEAGLAEASFALSQGRTGVIATENVPAVFGRGVYWVEADELPGDRTALRCTAQVGTAEFVVRTMVLPNVNPVTSLGFFGTDGVSIGWGTVVDGYHSGDGSYASLVDPSLPVHSTGSMGLVGSDSDIELKETSPTDEEILGVTSIDAASAAPASSTSSDGWMSLASSGSGGSGGTAGTGGTGSTSAGTTPTSTTLPSYPTHVYGRLRPGARSVVRSGGVSVIAGEIAPFDAPPTLPEITLPTPDERISGSLRISSDQTGLGANVETWVDGDVIVESGATLKIVGPALLRCRTFQLQHHATLELDDTDGPIHVYASSGLNFWPGTWVRSIADEGAAQGTCFLVPGAANESDRIRIRSSGNFHGALYAPDDIIRIPRGLHWLGCAVGRILFAAPGSHITHDRRMILGGNGFPAIPHQLSWQIVPLGTEVARQLPIDPMLALALRGVTPVPSAAGAIETNVEIRYINGSGQPARHIGSLAAYPGGATDRILGARWTDPRDGAVRPWATPAGSESTDAIAEERQRIRSLKRLIQASNAALDVAAMSDAEVIVEVSSIMAGLDVSAEPVEIQRAVQRVDAAEATLLPNPVEAALSAASFADEFAAKANTIQTEADALPVLATNPAAATPLITALRAAVAATAQAAADCRQQSTNALLATGAALDQAAQAAILLSEEAVKQYNSALNLYEQLKAL